MQCIASQMSRYIYVRVACAYQRTGRRLSIDPVRYSFSETLVWVYFTSTRARRQARLSFRLVKFSVTTNHNAVTMAIELRWNKLALGPLHTVRYSLSCTIGFHAAFSCRVVVISIILLGCTTAFATAFAQFFAWVPCVHRPVKSVFVGWLFGYVHSSVCARTYISGTVFIFIFLPV